MSFLRSKLGRALFLVILITSVYAPFLGSRYVRSAGDEKVYVSQAIEMARNQSWFVQTLQDEPNYYKGPLHYVLLRVGIGALGHSPWAVLYMNFVLLLLGSLALAAVVRRRLPEWKGGDIWIGTAFAFGIGIYAHASASQMEVELACFFAIGAWLLDRLETTDAGFAFWTLTGVIGWIKSPLHSAFLGTSALLFSATQRTLIPRLKNPKAWLAVFWGIIVCISGYLPAYFLDRENFWNAYVIRETLRKSDGSGQDWSVAVLSTFGFYLFPWVLVALVTYAQTLGAAAQGYRQRMRPETRRVLCLGFSLFLPSTLFFIWHVYRFENYNLPVIAGVWIWIAALWSDSRAQERKNMWQTAYSLATGATGVLFLILPVLLTALQSRFSPMPSWWPSYLVPLSWAFCLISAAGFIYFGAIQRGRNMALLAASSVGYLWVLGLVLVTVGEREMIDLRSYLAQALDQAKSQNRELRLDYYNLNHNIWSEWGLLQFWIHYPVVGIHSPEKLNEALLRGDTILVTAKENGIEEFNEFVRKNHPELKLRALPWKRWRTRGQSNSGKPLWREAWDTRSLNALEVDYLIVTPEPQH